MLQRFNVPGAPEPQGPYSPAVRCGGLLFVSGQGPIDPASNEFRLGGIREQTRLVLSNIERILNGCGASRQDVIRCNVYLAEADDFQAMNEVYAEFFGSAKPARTTVCVTLVEPGMKVEIDCIARAPEP